MERQAQRIDELAPLELGPETVKAYIRAHPETITDDPDLLCALVPESYACEGAALDVQSFAIDHLKSQGKELIRQRDRAFDTLRQNSAAARITENAVLTVLEARNFEDMVRIVTKQIGPMIQADHIVLCIEEFDGMGDDLATIEGLGVRVVPECAVDAALGEVGNSVLRSNAKGIKTLFGPCAEDIRSYAFVRLAISPEAPPGLMAIGSRRADTFHPSQGADMLEFLGSVIERQIGSWLGLPRG